MNRRLPPLSTANFRPQISSPSTLFAPQRPNPSLPSRRPPPLPLANLLSRIEQIDPHQCPAYIELLDRCIRSHHHPRDPETLHLHLTKRGFSADQFLSNNLINQYAKSGKLENAHKVFDEIPEKNVVTWTSLIAGYAHSGLFEEAFDLFVSSLSEGITPTQFTFGGVIRACQESGPGGLRLGRQIHGLISKTIYVENIVVCNALISMYGGSCWISTRDAQRVFDCMAFKNSITWNAIISVHAKQGDACAAFTLFSEMQKEGDGFDMKPNEYTFGSLVKVTNSCAISLGLCVIDQMMARVSKVGLLTNLYVCSALVSALARFGLLDQSMRMFLEMGDRNAVSMNGLMVALVKQNLGEEAVEIFRRTQDSVALSSDSYVVLLSALTEFSVSEVGRRLGREVHGHVIQNGLMASKVAIGNGLVNMYAKCGVIDDARSVFEHMSVRDQVTWNTMISGLDQNGLFDEAVASFSLMLRAGILPSNFAVISILSSCASLQLLSTGMQVHCDGVKLGIDLDVSVCNSLLTMYGDCGRTSECRKVFKSMPEYDLISWNSMIGALANSEVSQTEIVGVFADMMQGGWKPNRVTFVNILSALSQLMVIELGRQIHASMLKHGVSEGSSVENALLTCYAKSGDMDTCESLFVGMSNIRDAVSWNCMIAGYIQNGLLTKAMDFVWLMIQNGETMDDFTFATVLSAYASVAALERGMEIHAYGVRSYLKSDVVVDSALVDMYCKCGRIDYASKVFRSMPLKNEFSWNSMISGYARHGHGERALDLFREMQTGNHQPNHVTFVGVLSACSHAGLVEQGLDYFETMSKGYGLLPRMEHYSCVVDLLGRAGKLEKIEDFIKKMPMNPNSMIWRTVLVACCRSKGSLRTELGKQASDMLLELEPENPVNYVLTSSLYASIGRWGDVADARAAMRLGPVRKEAGCSWVTLRDGVHVFTAGDRSHPDTQDIYAKLAFLNQKMKDAGYAPQTEVVLYDLDMENKEELLSYHSEKLAVAFVLTRSSGVPIRIMKNLRVCGDCHSAFRHISEIVGRQIILRDSSRFHHFDNGKCSCGDYW